jgi:hypothetical protein
MISTGIMEKWNGGMLGLIHYSNIPSFQVADIDSKICKIF